MRPGAAGPLGRTGTRLGFAGRSARKSPGGRKTRDSLFGPRPRGCAPVPKVLLRAGVVGADPGRSHDRWVPTGDLPRPGASLLDDLPGAGPQRRTGGRPGGAGPATCRSDALATEAGPGAGGAVAQEMTPRQLWSGPNPGRRLPRGPRPAVVVPGREHPSAVVAPGPPAGTARGGLSGGVLAMAAGDLVAVVDMPARQRCAGWSAPGPTTAVLGRPIPTPAASG